ncbi:MAG: GNAT family N-acetyltransferase [Azospirillaceae bacterium]
MGPVATAAAEPRPARDSDALGLIALIGGCFAEYPGCVLDVDGEIPELNAIASHVAARDGRFWVVEDDTGGIAASIGAVPRGDGAGVELIKLYVRADYRRRGLARRLIALVEAFARQRGARYIDLWSDSRFVDAHATYEKLGYLRLADTRALEDKSDTIEFHFLKHLGRR